MADSLQLIAHWSSWTELTSILKESRNKVCHYNIVSRLIKHIISPTVCSTACLVSKHNSDIISTQCSHLPANRLLVPMCIQDNNNNTKAMHYWSCVKRIHRPTVDSPQKEPIIGKTFPCHDVCAVKLVVSLHIDASNMEIFSHGLSSCCLYCIPSELVPVTALRTPRCVIYCRCLWNMATRGSRREGEWVVGYYDATSVTSLVNNVSI